MTENLRTNLQAMKSEERTGLKHELFRSKETDVIN